MFRNRYSSLRFFSEMNSIRLMLRAKIHPLSFLLKHINKWRLYGWQENVAWEALDTAQDEKIVDEYGGRYFVFVGCGMVVVEKKEDIDDDLAWYDFLS